MPISCSHTANNTVAGAWRHIIHCLHIGEAVPGVVLGKHYRGQQDTAYPGHLHIVTVEVVITVPVAVHVQYESCCCEVFVGGMLVYIVFGQ